jgi:hypothetical protein
VPARGIDVYLPRKEGLIMFSHLAMSDELVRDLVNERLREAEHERLVLAASRPGRPVRVRVAGWLFAVARRLEGQPQASVTPASAEA